MLKYSEKIEIKIKLKISITIYEGISLTLNLVSTLRICAMSMYSYFLICIVSNRFSKSLICYVDV